MKYWYNIFPYILPSLNNIKKEMLDSFLLIEKNEYV